MISALQTSLKLALRRLSLWGEKEWTVGPFSILACDTSVSVNLLAPSSKDLDEPAFTHYPSYGVTIEPFMISLMGRDGDVAWCSPRCTILDWLDDEWIPIGDLSLEVQASRDVIQNYVLGDDDYPCAGNGLRFRDPEITETKYFVPGSDNSFLQWVMYPEIEIHKNDVDEFCRRVRNNVGFGSR